MNGPHAKSFGVPGWKIPKKARQQIQAPAPDSEAAIEALRKILEPRGLWGKRKQVGLGVYSFGRVVVNTLTCQVYISGAKSKDDPETQELARAIADVFD